MSEPLDPAALFQRLHEAGIRYVVIGGFAVIAHGVQRTTKDLDICLDPDRENLVRVAELLRDLDARHAESADFEQHEFPFDPTNPDELAQGGNFRLETDLGSLDVMQWADGIPGNLAYPSLAREAITAEVRGVPVSVCSLEHLKAMKRAAGRPRDRQDLADLEAAAGDGGE